MQENKWWKNAVIYQIYPRSFCDSNNDGIGDIKGIISKLDYLKDLGIDAIWLSPIYKSPMKDNGYDVSDYFEINEEFGTMEDVESLIQEGKKRNIKIIMDLVANHTSDQHKWFQEALKGKDNKYHNFFYWSDKKDDKTADFGGSSWKYVPSLNEYYYHYFAPSQVDLNWTNPEVRKEVANIVNFWLEKGVAGFRLDAIELIGKELDKNIFANGPKIHEYLHELNENSFGKWKDSITVGEGWPTTAIALDYTRPERKELDMMFNFEIVAMLWGKSKLHKFAPAGMNVVEFKNIIKRWQNDLYDKAWNTLFVENHDIVRCVNSMGDADTYRVESAKAIAYIMYLQQGTPYIYQGQEIGMTNANFKTLDQYKDIDSLGHYHEFVDVEKIATKEEMLEGLAKGSRDNARTPMQWNDSINAGFNTGTTPWIEVNKNYKEINVDKQEKEKNSILNAYKDLITLRKSEEFNEVILNAPYKSYLDDDLNFIVYERKYNGKGILVVSNFSKKSNTINLNIHLKKILLSNYQDSKLSINNVTFRPYETIVFEI